MRHSQSAVVSPSRATALRAFLALLTSFGLTVEGAGLPYPAYAGINDAQGVYLIFNSLATKTFVRTQFQFQQIVKDPARLDLLEGVNYRVAWRWLEPATDSTEGWDYLISELKYLASLRKSNGEPLKIDLRMDIARLTPLWLHEAPYNVPRFYYKRLTTQSGGSTIYENAEVAIPWVNTYTQRVQTLIENLADRLKSDLTLAEYALITQVGIAAPGGAVDTFVIPLREADPTIPEALENRPEATQCSPNGVGVPFYHNYEMEWQDPCFTGGNPYVIPDTGNRLAIIQREIEDQFAAAFAAKTLMRPVWFYDDPQLLDPERRPVSRDVLGVWELILKDSVDRYHGRYVLQIHALHGGTLGRYDYDNILEKHRVQDGAMVSFEMVSGSDAAGFQGSLRDAFINGINRGAKTVAIFMSELKGSTDENAPNYNPNLEQHLDDLRFVQTYYDGDYSLPPKISGLGASTGTNRGQITVTWSAPADDSVAEGPLGVATRYLVKYSRKPITNSMTFHAATLYQQSWVPARVGKTETFTLRGLTPGATYYIAVKPVDDRGSVSQGFATASARAAP